jgi:hypothetical protein
MIGNSKLLTIPLCSFDFLNFWRALFICRSVAPAAKGIRPMERVLKTMLTFACLTGGVLLTGCAYLPIGNFRSEDVKKATFQPKAHAPCSRPCGPLRLAPGNN